MIIWNTSFSSFIMSTIDDVCKVYTRIEISAFSTVEIVWYIYHYFFQNAFFYWWLIWPDSVRCLISLGNKIESKKCHTSNDSIELHLTILSGTSFWIQLKLLPESLVLYVVAVESVQHSNLSIWHRKWNALVSSPTNYHS